MEYKVNAYQATADKLQLDKPFDMVVRSIGSKFCAIKIEDKEYLVEGSHMVVAIQAACADAR